LEFKPQNEIWVSAMLSLPFIFAFVNALQDGEPSFLGVRNRK
jgi:hypothetical protein